MNVKPYHRKELGMSLDDLQFKQFNPCPIYPKRECQKLSRKLCIINDIICCVNTLRHILNQ